MRCCQPDFTIPAYLFAAAWQVKHKRFTPDTLPIDMRRIRSCLDHMYEISWRFDAVERLLKPLFARDIGLMA